MKKVSIVSTAYNENENLPFLCSEIVNVLSKVKYNYEIIIVDNGSSDNSLTTLKQLSEKIPSSLKNM